jgi:hypothetical protein
VARLRCRLAAVRGGRATREVDDAVAVDVDGQLGTVVKAGLELSVELRSELLSIAVGNLWHSLV